MALTVRFGTLADGISYTAQSTLDVKAKNIRASSRIPGTARWGSDKERD